jgi:hypothetical protein
MQNFNDQSGQPLFTYGCVCTGISVPTLGAKHLDWKAQFFSEIEAYLELDPLYVDVIIRRWQRRTKRDAIHVESGASFGAREASRVSQDASISERKG